ncbi:STAS domain-containing protein [Magnetofaba australis]|uniref:Putative anti-anti-sigma factor n=1 Tax=Magnetofaba australis IT-1 TaxID=1434232 RepID=A0A1Y2JZ75_9PROT|nr:STAS domain-containing protein [Magnetofaba australis]OSM00198.1 putative anti-anti-sigma factor [Magnetofaba australis IT-1]
MDSGLVTQQNNDLTITTGAVLDVASFPEFRQIILDHSNTPLNLCMVDMRQTHRITSSGIGMLMLLKEETSAQRYSVCIAHPDVAYALEIANLHKHFDITQG